MYSGVLNIFYGIVCKLDVDQGVQIHFNIRYLVITSGWNVKLDV